MSLYGLYECNIATTNICDSNSKGLQTSISQDIVLLAYNKPTNRLEYYRTQYYPHNLVVCKCLQKRHYPTLLQYLRRELKVISILPF